MNRNWIKKALALTLAGVMAIPALQAPAFAAGNDDFYQQLAQLLEQQDDSSYFNSMELSIGSNTLTIDGKEQQMDVSPTLKNNRTMLPIRAIAEAAGAEVYFDDASRTVIITGVGGETILCQTGASAMTINDETLTLDTPSFIQGGRTYLPVRAVSEALNLDVQWEAETRTVTITAPYQTCRVLAWTDQLDAEGLGADTVLNDGSGLWVLQFSTPGLAKAAVDTLQSRGIQAEPDAYIPPIDDTESTEAGAQAANSWGVADCQFDTFVKNNQSRMTQSGVVAVVDTGVDATHSFLKGKVLSGRDFVDGDSNPADEHYHGTHVAATVLDCAGTAPVKILPVRVLDKKGSGYDTTIVSGIRYAADQQADVINLSLGGRRGSTGTDNIDRAIQYAVGKGTLVVAAAGNDNMDTKSFCPSHLTDAGVVVVSAGDSKHQKAYFSNYGTSVDVMAPGVSIRAAVPGNSYKTLNGTSMAAPHVAAAAVLLDLSSGKSLTPAQLETKVRAASTNSGTWKDKYMGCGFLTLKDASQDVTPVPVPGDKKVTSYRYNVSSLNLKVGDTSKVTVTAVYSDGSTKDVTSSAALYSTDPSVASVDKSGNVKALKKGNTVLTMGSTPSASGVSIPKPISVTVTEAAPDAKVTAYRYNVSSLNLKVGDTAKVTVTAVYSDGSTKDVTSSAALYSTSSSVASVDKNGNVKALKKGTASIAMGSTPASGVSIPKPIDVTVTDPQSPAPGGDATYTRLYWAVSRVGDTSTAISIAKGTNLQIDVCGETKDGRTVKLTKDCGIYSSDTSVITINSSGLLTAVGTGEAYLYIQSAPNTGLTLPPILSFVVK